MSGSDTEAGTHRAPRWLKIIAAIVAGFSLGVALLWAALPALLSSDLARSELAARIQAATGRKTSVGTFRFSWDQGLELKNLAVGTGDLENAEFLCAVDSLRLGFGVHSLWTRRAWLTAEISGVRARLQPDAPPALETGPGPAPAQALKHGLETLRQNLRPVPVTGDLDISVRLREITAITDLGGKELRIHVPKTELVAPSLRKSPIGLNMEVASWINGAPLPNLDLQAEIADLVDQQRLLRPGSTKLKAGLRTQGLTLDASGGLDTGLHSDLNIDLAKLVAAFRPLLPASIPNVFGLVRLQTLVSLKGPDNLAASFVLSGSSVAISATRPGQKNIGPLDFNLMQEAGIDLASGTLEMPGAFSMLTGSRAAWHVRATGIADEAPEFTLRSDGLHLDLGELGKPLARLLPPDAVLMQARLSTGPIRVRLRPARAPGGAPDLSVDIRDLALGGRGIQAGPAGSRISLGGLNLRSDALALDLPHDAPGTFSLAMGATIENASLSGPRRMTLRHAELSRLTCSGKDLRFTGDALFGLSGSVALDLESSATGLEVAGLLNAPALSKSIRLGVDLPAQQRLALTLEQANAAIPGFRLLRPGSPALELPLRFQASAREVTLTRQATGVLAPAVSETTLEAALGQAVTIRASGSLDDKRHVASQGELSLDAGKLAPILALLPQHPKASGSLTLDWSVRGALPQSGSSGAAPDTLAAKLRELNALRSVEATLSLKALSLHMPLAAGPDGRQETLKLRGISTPRPLRLSITQGLAESSLSGTLAFGPLEELPGLGRLRRPSSGMFTLSAAQQGLRSAQVSQMLSLDGFRLNENISFTLDKLDALLDAKDFLSTALDRVDATATFHLATGLDALPLASDKGVSGRGGLELSSELRLAGGRSLTIGTRLRSPGLDLRLGPEMGITGLSSDLSLRRRYALQSGLACPGADTLAALPPLSEQVFDLFPGPVSPLSPTQDFGLRTLYDAQSHRSGAVAFAALDLRSGPLPLALRDFALALDTSGPLPEVRSFRLGLFGGNVLGRAAISGSTGTHSLDASCSFTGIDTSRMLPAKAEQDLGEQAELSGKLSLRLPLTPDPEALLTRMYLNADITKVGPRTLERALYALDPDETNETIVQQRRLMAIGYPRNLALRIAYGNLSLSGQVEVKGFRLDIPPIDRLSVANLPVKGQLASALAPVPALLDMLDFISATSICREPAQPGQPVQPGRLGSLKLSRTAPAQGAKP